MSYRQQISLGLILFAGLIPVAGVTLLDWSVVEVMLSIWLELTIGAIFFSLRGVLAVYSARHFEGRHADRWLGFLGGTVVAMFTSGVLMTAAVVDGSVIDGAVAMYVAFRNLPELLLPAAIWTGMEYWRLRGDYRRGRPLRGSVGGGLYIAVGLGGSITIVALARDLRSPEVMLVAVLVLKLAADLWVFRDARRVTAAQWVRLNEELAGLLELDIGTMRRHGETRMPGDDQSLGTHGAELHEQVQRIYASQQPDYTVIQEFYMKPEWQNYGGDQPTTTRILQIIEQTQP